MKQSGMANRHSMALCGLKWHAGRLESAMQMLVSNRDTLGA